MGDKPDSLENNVLMTVHEVVSSYRPSLADLNLEEFRALRVDSCSFDSLDFTTLSLDFEDKLGVVVSAEEISSATTFEDLLANLEAVMGGFES